MKHCLAQLKIDLRFRMQLLLLFSLPLTFNICCSGQNIPLSVSKEPVFSETTEHPAPSGKKLVYRNDYYLVDVGTNLEIDLKPFLDSTARRISGERSNGADEYLLFFYKNDSFLNRHLIMKEEPQYRYKLFLIYKDNNYLASYYYRGSKFINMNWNAKFEGQRK